MVIHEKWPVEHDAKSLVFEEVAHYLHNLLASRYSYIACICMLFRACLLRLKPFFVPCKFEIRDCL
jgi:hypothetical protein